MTTVNQPPQCDLQRGIPQPHRTTHVTRRHAKCRTPRENQKTSKRTYPQPPHTRAALHRRLQPLYTEKRKVSCSGFLPNTSPMHHSCSHSNAICNQGFHNRIELRRHEDTQSAEHQGRTKKTSKRAYPQPPYTGAALHRLLQPLYTEKHKVFLPNTSLMQHSCSHYNAFVLECAVLKPHTTLHDVLCDVKFHTTLHDVLLCDVKFHTTLHEFIVLWCKVSQFYLPVTRQIASQLPLIIEFYLTYIT